MAAAALALAHANTGAPFDPEALQALAPLDMQAVRACSARLAALHRLAASGPDAPQLLQGVAPVRDKYAREEWSHVALMPPASGAGLPRQHTHR